MGYTLPEVMDSLEVVDLDIEDDMIMSQWRDMHLAWLHADNLWEPIDQEHLDKPTEYILNCGGKLVGIINDDNLIATVAMKPVHKYRWEIMKLAVSPAYRRKGLGDRMLRHAIEYCAQEMAAVNGDRCACEGYGSPISTGIIQLDSSSKLSAAIKLYQKFGFISIQDFEKRYETADTFMELMVPL